MKIRKEIVMAEKSGAADSPQVEALRQQLANEEDARAPEYTAAREEIVKEIHQKVQEFGGEPAQFSRNILKNRGKVERVLHSQDEKTKEIGATILQQAGKAQSS